MIPAKARPVEILLVEDNEGDVLLTQEAFSEAKIANHIHVAMDGAEALEFLRKEDKYSDAKTPDMVLLDLNLPKKNGKEVLEEIKKDNNLKHIPVIIMTSSKSEEDVIKTYDLHANSYVVKPVNLEKFVHIVEAIENFWFTVVVLPRDE